MMKDTLKSFLTETIELVRCISTPYRRKRRAKRRQMRREMEYQYYKGLSPDQYSEALKKWYRKHTGKTLNLENPQTFNEKIQWLKLHDRDPLKTKLSDKYLVRDWVAEKIGAEYLVTLLGVYDKFEDIEFDVLPNKFAIKTTHDSVSHGIVTDKSKFNIAKAKEYFDWKMRINVAFASYMEPYYKNIVPKIIVEEYLENSENELHDYKFMCFGGKVQFIWFQTEWQTGLKVALFDTEWQRLSFSIGVPEYEEDVEEPDNLEQMIKLAETLAAGFIHVRVDFYRLNDGTIKFGEMLFSPDDDRPYRWNPPEYDKIIGDFIKLPIDKN